MRSRRNVALAACAFLSLPAWTARADTPVVLPPVHVPAPPPPEVPPPATSPTRDEPSAATTTVRVQDFAGRLRDAAELVSSAPGVSLKDSGGFAQSRSVSIRGAGSNGVLVLLDGVPLNGAGGIADLSRIPVALLDRVEVARGALGARYGSGGLGGVVNLVSAPTAEAPRFSASLGYGSFETATADLAAAVNVAQTRAMLIATVGRSRGDFVFEHDELPTLAGNPVTVQQRVNNDSLLAGALLKLDRPFGGGVASAVFDFTAIDRGLAGTVQNPTGDARERGARLSASARYLHRFSSDSEASLQLAARHARDHFEGGYFATPVAQQLTSVLARGRVDHLWGAHFITAELELGYDQLREPTAANPSWMKGAIVLRDEVSLAADRLLVSGSLRAEAVGPYRLATPRLGAELFVSDAVTLFGNAALAFRAPSFLELYVVQGALLPNPDLDAERALSADAGVRWTAQGLGTASVGGFYSHYADLISYEYYPPFLARPFNIGAGHAFGVEAEASWQSVSWAQAVAGYTLMVAQNLSTDWRYHLKALPYRPMHRGHLRASAGPRWLNASAELSVQSRQYMNRTQSERLVIPDRALLHLSASWLALQRPQLRLTFEIKNALDAHVADLDGYPLPGRALYLSLGFSTEPVAPLPTQPQG